MAPTDSTLKRLAEEVASRTSLTLDPTVQYLDLASEQTPIKAPWLFIDGSQKLSDISAGQMTPQMYHWLVNGGFLIIENADSLEALQRFIEPITKASMASRGLVPGLDPGSSSPESLNPRGKPSAAGPKFGPIAPDHELMRSFYLLSALPKCSARSEQWRALRYDGRLMILAVPFSLTKLLADGSAEAGRAQSPNQGSCNSSAMQEQLTRTFVNILMVVLATDYKMDQIHLPEILKRLR